MEEIVAMVGIVSTFIGFPMVIVSYLKWKHQNRSSGIPLEAAARIEARMERIEQAIDTIALETERVAEVVSDAATRIEQCGVRGPAEKGARLLDRVAVADPGELEKVRPAPT